KFTKTSSSPTSTGPESTFSEASIESNSGNVSPLLKLLSGVQSAVAGHSVQDPAPQPAESKGPIEKNPSPFINSTSPAPSSQGSVSLVDLKAEQASLLASQSRDSSPSLPFNPVEASLGKRS